MWRSMTSSPASAASTALRPMPASPLSSSETLARPPSSRLAMSACMRSTSFFSSPLSRSFWPCMPRFSVASLFFVMGVAPEGGGGGCC